MATLCNSINLPFTIIIPYGNDSEIQVTEIYHSSEHTKTEQLIELKEGLRTGIQFFVDNEEDIDDEAKIEIQTSLYNNTDTQKPFVYPLTKKPLTKWMFEYKDDQEDFPWRMGTYLIRIYYKGISYTTSFSIKPLYLNDQQVYTIHQYLEEKVEGIIYDLIYSNQTLAKQEKDLLSDWYYDYARYMMDHKDAIYYFLLALEKEPISLLVSDHRISSSLGKRDRKSIQWESTSRGLSKSMNSNSQNYFYNRVKREDYNHKANQWMKTILFRWNSDIRTVIDIITNRNHAIKEIIVSLKEKTKKLESRKTYIGFQKGVARTEWVDIKAQTTITNNDLKKNNEIFLQQRKWLEQLQSVRIRIINLLNNSFLSEVELGKMKPLLTTNHYYQLDMLYNKSKLIQKYEGDKERHIKIYKPFWQIYEYYCLFTIIDLLIKSGLKLQKAPNVDLMKAYYESSIPAESFFKLENSKVIIDCWYDKYHNDKIVAEKNGDRFFTTQEKRRPDIKLDLYQKQTDGPPLFDSCIIIDAKFRKLSYLFNDRYATATREQLTKYSNFYYLGGNRRLRSVVERIICLYGSKNKDSIRKEQAPLIYINLFPSILENGVIENTGEKELFEEIFSWIDEAIPGGINQ